MASAGTAYVQIRGDLSNLNKQLVANLHPSRLGGMGKKAGLAIGAGLAVGVGVAAAGKAAFDLGQDFDNAFDKIRVATGKTGKELKGLKGDFNEVFKSAPGSMDDTAKAVGGLGARLNQSGKPLQKLSKTLLELAHITGTDVQENVESVTRLFKDWGTATDQQVPTLNKLFRVFQKTGLTVDKNARLLVAFGSPLRQLGFDFDTAAAMFGRFEKEGVNLTTILPGFRFALKNLAAPTSAVTAQLKKLGAVGDEPRVALQKVFKAIKDAPTDLKANAIAFEIFGKRAGPDMAAAVREGRLELDKLKDAMRNGTDTIHKAEKDTRDFGEEWELLKKRLQVALQPAGLSIFGAISKDLAKVNKIIADPSLSKNEKISAAFDVILDRINVVMPKIANAVGQAAPKVALAFVKGFMNANAWGQLAVGGFLISRLGGLKGIFRTAGVGAGASASAGVAEGMTTGAGAASVTAGLKTLAARVSIIGGLFLAGVVAGKKLQPILADLTPSKVLSGLKDAATNIGKVGGSLDRAGIAARFAGPAMKAQAQAVKDYGKALGETLAASQQTQAFTPQIIAAERTLADLRKQGKTGTHAYAEALRQLDAAEAGRAAALRARTVAQQKAITFAKLDYTAAVRSFQAARQQGLSFKELIPYMNRVNDAAERGYAAQLNLSRAMRGLSPIAGAAGGKLGVLLKSVEGLAGAKSLKKLLVTTDFSQATAAVKVVTKLQGLGRVKTALRIIAESKSPEEALKKLRKLVSDLADHRHQITMQVRDEATRRLAQLQRAIDRLPERKTLTFKASAELTRDTRRLLNFADRGQAAKQMIFGSPGRAKGGTVKRDEAMTLVGEEGPELVRLPVGSRVHSHPESKRMAKGMGIQAFAKGGTVKKGKVLEHDPDERTLRSASVRISTSGVTASDVSAISNRWNVNRAVASIAAASIAKFARGLGIISGFRPNSITSSGSISNHSRHAALDIGPVYGARNTEIGNWISSTFPASLRGTNEPVFRVGHDLPTKEHHDHVHAAAFGSKALAKALGGGGKGKSGRITGGRLSLGQIVTLAQKVGFPDPALAAAVAYAESRGAVGATGDGGDSHGLWQINSPAHPNYNAQRLEGDAFYNARAALAISKRGRSWGPWTQFRTGAYKQFLGGKATPLPKGTGGAGSAQGNSLADYIAMRQELATDSPGTKDDLRWINRGLKYWRGVFRRNKAAGNFQRVTDANQKIRELREQKRALTQPDDSIFELGGLSRIGKINLAGLKPTMDQIELDTAKASLTEGLGDDVKAASHLVQIWNDLYNLATKGWPGVSGPGTRPQQTEAATQLKSAQDALKSAQADANESGEGSLAAGADSRIADLLKQQLEATRKELGIFKAQFPIFEQFKKAPRFQGGGVMPGPSGGDQPAWVSPKEGVFTPEQMKAMGGGGVVVIIEDEAIDRSKIRVVAEEAMSERDREMVRKARAGGPAPGRRYVMPR